MNDSGKIKVLIVDDEEYFRKTTAAILERRGFAVSVVPGGLEAIEEIKKNGFEVVILDLKMPGMDGNEALREIKKLEPGLEVIMLTGHGTPESALHGLKDGVFDYLSKPANVDLLAQRIRDAVNKKKGLPAAEPRVREVMVALSSFSAIREDRQVMEAVNIIILESFSRSMSTSTLQETVHRSILVLDRNDQVVGVMTFTDLLQGLQPPYMRLLAERPSMADSIYLESPSYSGMFTIMARDLARKKVSELMSEAPPTIDADANLMEAVNRLLNLGVRRLLVVEKGKPIGVLREQDLFFEMANIMKRSL